jgi:hypothetical protein
MRELKFYPFMGNQGLSCSQRGSGVSLCTVVGRPNSICRVAEYNSVEELEFELLDRRD